MQESLLLRRGVPERGVEEAPEDVLSTSDILHKVRAADAAGDWKEVFELEGRLEELLVGQSDDDGNYILAIFASAHSQGLNGQERPYPLGPRTGGVAR